MKKLVKKFLILSQVLGWSALVASACTEEQVKTTVQNAIDSSKLKDNTDNTTNNPNQTNSDASKDGSGDASNKKEADISHNENGEVAGNKASNGKDEESGKLTKSNSENSSEDKGSSKAKVQASESQEQHMGKTEQDGANDGKKSVADDKTTSKQEPSHTINAREDTAGSKSKKHESVTESSASPQAASEVDGGKSGTGLPKPPAPNMHTDTDHGQAEDHTSS